MTDDGGVHALLSLCARPHLPQDLWPELRLRAAGIARWDAALAAAERHGVAPLLYRHLKNGQADVPPDVRHQLSALYIRHRRANAARLNALGDILDLFDDRRIPLRILKGTALMALVYEDAALRPVSDLDLLLPAGDVARGQQALREMGFDAPSEKTGPGIARHHHLPAARKLVDGVTVQVELHRNALCEDYRDRMTLDDDREPPAVVRLSGREALTLGPHEMLWHLCQHLVGAFPQQLRLIWLADVFGFAEKYSRQLDWDDLADRYPVVLRVLSVANSLSPLPEGVARHVPPRFHAALDRDASAWA